MKKTGKRWLAALLAAIMAFGLLPMSALADGAAEPAPDVKYGDYNNGAWVEDSSATGTLTTDLPSGVTKVSKTATKTADNTYEIDLEVEMSETTSTTTPDAAATVLAIDCSGSMAWCSKCGNEHCWCTDFAVTYNVENDRIIADYYIKVGDNNYQRVYYCNGTHGFIQSSACDGGAGWYTSSEKDGHTQVAKFYPMTSASDTDSTHKQFYTRTSASSRIVEAKKAAVGFLQSYSGYASTAFNASGTINSNAGDLNYKRYVAVVKFANNETHTNWYDVSTRTGYTAIYNAINTDNASGATNLDAALKAAGSLLGLNTVESCSAKNVIALTDGAPTKHMEGNEVKGDGNSCTDATFNATKNSAATLKNNGEVKLYTVCYCASNEKMDGQSITLEAFLKDNIATQPATGSSEQYAYTAANASALPTVFAAISSSITSGLSAGTVSDTLPAGVTTTSSDFTNTWNLTKETATSKSISGDTTTYTWTKTYTVTIDPTNDAVQNKDYYPLNGVTTLTVAGSAPVSFPIPAGKVTPSTPISITPSLPTDVTSFLTNAVKVDCTNTDMSATHVDKCYNVTDSTHYSVGTVSGSEEAGYTCTITLTAAGVSNFIAEYNTTHTGHTQASATNDTTITLKYEDDEWVKADSNDIFVVNVTCTTPTYKVTYKWSGLPEGTTDPACPTDSNAYKAGDTVTIDNKFTNGTTAKVGNDNYVFLGWSVSPALTDGKMPTSDVTVTGIWGKDNWKQDGTGGDSETGGDGIADKYQVLVKYTASDNGSIKDGAKTVEVFTLKNDDNYVTSGTVTASGSEAVANTDYAFDYWTDPSGNTISGEDATLSAQTITNAEGGETYTYTAYFDTDKVGGKDPETGKDKGDGIPDKYQKKVTFTVVNGTWADGTTADQVTYVTLKTDGKYNVNGTAAFPTAPTGMKANKDYGNGAWNVTFPETLSGADAVTYTYTFVKAGAATFNPNEPDNGYGKQSPILNKKLNGTLSTSSETFVVTLTPTADPHDHGGEVVPDAPAVTTTTSTVASYTGRVTMTAAGTEAFVFDNVMTFDAAGDYWFAVTETAGSNSYITYDDHTYYLCIKVTQDEATNKLTVNNWYFLDGEGKTQTITNTSSYVYVPPYIPTPTTINVKGLDTVNHTAYIVGVGKDLVSPLGTITRAEVATIYFRLMTKEWRDLYWSDTNSYTDVTADKWYNVAVSTLEKAGIIKDTATGGAFRPNDPITRAELSVMAAQFCTVTGNIPRTSFADVPTTHWAYKEIALIEYAGWIEGYAGYFYPDQNLSRAECVTIVNRMLNRGAEPEHMLKDMVTFKDNLNRDAWYYAAIQEAVNSHTYGRTGKLLTGETCIYAENWTALLPATDWAALEAAWTQAYKAN